MYPLVFFIQYLGIISFFYYRFFYYPVYFQLPKIPITLTNVVCTGSETNLLQCSHEKRKNTFCDYYDEIQMECVGKKIIM